MMEDLLFDALECSVCLNQLDSTARVLPCQHTFCYGCLSDIARSHKEVLCPECRVLVTVPIDQLPSNILLIRILEGIKNRPSPTPRANVSQQKSTSVSAPTTTDYSYILKLYDQPGITSFPGGSAASNLSSLPPADDTSLALQPSSSDLNSVGMFAVGNALPGTASANSSLNSLTSSSSLSTDFIPACALPPVSNPNSFSPLYNTSLDSRLRPTVSSSPVPFLSNGSAASSLLHQMSALSLSGSPMANTSQSSVPVTSTLLSQQNFLHAQSLTSRASSFSPSLAECQMASTSNNAQVGGNGFSSVFPQLQSSSSTVLQTSLPSYSSASMLNKSEAVEVTLCSTGMSSSNLTDSTVQSLMTLLPQSPSVVSAPVSTATTPLQNFSTSITSAQTVPILSNQFSVANISNFGRSLGSANSFSGLPSLSATNAVLSSASTSSSTDNILSSQPSMNAGVVSSNAGGITCPATMSQTAPNSRSITPVFGANSALSGHSLAATPSVGSLLARPAVKPQPPTPVFARALFNYSGNEERDLSLQKGSIVTLLRVVDSNWVVGECGGRQGYLPSSYVQLLPSDSLPQAVALYDFKLPDTAVGHAAGCLTFSKGEVLSVSRRVDHNWAEGSVSGRKGIFPVSFVQLNAAAAALLQVNPPTTTTATDASRTCRPTESAVSVTASDRSTASLPRSATSLPSRDSLSTEPRDQSRAPVGNLNDDLPPLTIPANAGLPSSATKTGANNMAMLYVARFPYVPQKSDEVALTKGGLYAVTQRCHDGWFKGRCLTTHKTGVFPGNYLQPARGQTIADYIARLNNKGTSSPPSDTPCTGDAGGGSTADSPAHAPAVRRTVSAGVATLASPVAGGDSSPHHLTHIYRVSSASSLGSSASLHQKTEPTSVRLTDGTASPVRCAVSHSPHSVSATPTLPAPLLRERCRCIVAFPASTPRELALSVGDIVYVLQRPTSRAAGGGEEGGGDDGGVAEGWLYGLLLSTGQRGLFPSTFVEPF